jgi:pimeloyl-ACP methyl ester carboxylesterase
MEKEMNRPVNLFNTNQGQDCYFAAYDAALRLWPVPHESQDVTTAYGRTHVISCGPEDGFPLVLLHAGQASSTMWFPNIADLSARFHVLALVTIGEPGRSVPSQQYTTKRDTALWLEGVFDALGLAKTHVLGLSRGGGWL